MMVGLAKVDFRPKHPPSALSRSPHSTAHALNHPCTPGPRICQHRHCMNAAGSCLFTIRPASRKANTLLDQINQCCREKSGNKQVQPETRGQECSVRPQLSSPDAISRSWHTELISPWCMIGCLLAAAPTSKKYNPK